MLTLKLAFRNLFAHAKRNLIMFVIVTIVTCIVFLFMAFSDGEIENFKNGVMAIYNPSSDIVVAQKGMKDARDEGEDWKQLSAFTLKDSDALIDELEKRPEVDKATFIYPQLELSISAGGKRYNDFQFRSFEPKRNWQVAPNLTMKSGNLPNSDTIPQIILHYKVASTFAAKPGDHVIVDGKDNFGQVVSLEVELAGFYMPNQDNPNLIVLAFMNRAANAQLSGFNPGESYGIALKLKHGEKIESVIPALEKSYATSNRQLEFIDWNTLPARGFSIYGLIRMIFTVVSLLIVFVVSFGIMSVVSVNLYDRKREIGTYYCLGSEKGFLIRLYTTEILVLTMAATVAGIVVGALIRQIINSIGFRTEDMGMQLVFGGSQFSLGLSMESVAFVVGVMLVVTLVTSVTTLGKRLKVSPVAALRETE